MHQITFFDSQTKLELSDVLLTLALFYCNDRNLIYFINIIYKVTSIISLCVLMLASVGL